MTSDVERRLERLEHIDAARAVQARYAEVIDDWNIDRLDEVFSGDALVIAPGRRIEGLAAIKEWYAAVHREDPSARRHFITNVAVTAVDAGEVTLAAAFIYVAGTDGRSIIGWGRYVDVVAIVSGEARIVSKSIVVDHRGPVDASWGEALVAISTLPGDGPPNGDTPSE